MTVIPFKNDLVDSFTCAEIRVEVRIPNYQPIHYVHMISKEEAQENFGMVPLLKEDQELLKLYPEARLKFIERARHQQIPMLGEYLGKKIAYFIQDFLKRIDEKQNDSA